MSHNYLFHIVAKYILFLIHHKLFKKMLCSKLKLNILFSRFIKWKHSTRNNLRNDIWSYIIPPMQTVKKSFVFFFASEPHFNFFLKIFCCSLLSSNLESINKNIPISTKYFKNAHWYDSYHNTIRLFFKWRGLKLNSNAN